MAYTYDSATGDLDLKAGTNLNYNDAAHVHAVTHIGSTQKYWYDANGSQTKRIVGADTYDLQYDAENRLIEVKKNGVTIAQFTFDGDGNRVKSVLNGETTLFIGSYYEQSGSTVTKYYTSTTLSAGFAGTSRIAMRKYTIPQNMTIEYLLGDHASNMLSTSLGSTSITTDSTGIKVSELRYRVASPKRSKGNKPWGEILYSWTNAPATTPTYELTKYQYTGQYSYDAEFGLMFYNARWYDPALGRFAQADTVVPDLYNPSDWDRYSYVRSNPLRYTDPSGHYSDDEVLAILGVKTWKDAYKLFEKGGMYEGKWGILDILRMAENGDSIVNPFNGVAGSSEGDSLGNFVLKDGVLYFDQQGEYVSALSLLSNGDYDHLTLVENGSITRFTAVYIELNSPHSTWRTEFHPENIDWLGAGLDGGGIIADLFTFGLAGRFINGAKIAKNAGNTIGAVDLVYGTSQVVENPSVSTGASWLTDVVGLGVPIVPDVIGLLLNFGQAIEFQP